MGDAGVEGPGFSDSKKEVGIRPANTSVTNKEHGVRSGFRRRRLFPSRRIQSI